MHSVSMLSRLSTCLEQRADIVAFLLLGLIVYWVPWLYHLS